MNTNWTIQKIKTTDCFYLLFTPIERINVLNNKANINIIARNHSKHIEKCYCQVIKTLSSSNNSLVKEITTNKMVIEKGLRELTSVGIDIRFYCQPFFLIDLEENDYSYIISKEEIDIQTFNNSIKEYQKMQPIRVY